MTRLGSRSQQSQGREGVLQGLERGGGVIRWSLGLSVLLGQKAERLVILQLWPLPHRLCRPPRRPSTRQCLSEPSDGARQMAGPHACRQRQRVRGPARVAQHSSNTTATPRGKWAPNIPQEKQCWPLWPRPPHRPGRLSGSRWLKWKQNPPGNQDG